MQQIVSGEYIGTGQLNWGQSPYGVKLTEDPDKMFKTLIEQEKHSLDIEGQSDSEAKKTIQQWLDSLSNETVIGNDKPEGMKDADDIPLDEFSKGRKQSDAMYGVNYTDARVGGNDAINPYWQFNRDDDIVPRMLRVKGVTGGDKEYGLGRVYAEHYDAHQQILWLSMGVAEYTDLISFYLDAGDANAADVMNRGSLYGMVMQGFKFITNAVVWAFTMPIMAPLYIYRWFKRFEMTRVTRYYWFLPSMTLYYEMVNTMLTYLAINMGLYPTLFDKRVDQAKMLYTKDKLWSAQNRGNPIGDFINDAKFNEQFEGIPEVLKDGPDIFKIINRRAKLFNANAAKVSSRELLHSTAELETAKEHFTDYATNWVYKGEIKVGEPDPTQWVDKELENKNWEPVKPEQSKDGKVKGALKNWWATAKGSMFGSDLYVGFKVESTQNASESISNETGSTGIAQKLNSMAQQAKDEYEDSMGGGILGRLANKISSDGFEQGILGTIRGAVARKTFKILSKTGFGDIGTIISNGNGFMDIPDVWKSSSFNKNYSFNIELYARYGDPVSIFQSIYIPLVMLLAAGLPRSVGTSMYTSPFLVKAFCKGQFAIPCGIVSSLDVTRGKEQYGWSADMLPTQVSVSISLKDMTPAMFMGMQDIGIFDTMSRNETLHEYLDTLSALGISERLYIFPQFMRKMSAALHIKRNTIFSSTYWGGRFGRSPLMRGLGSIMPFYNHEKSDLVYNATR